MATLSPSSFATALVAAVAVLALLNAKSCDAARAKLGDDAPTHLWDDASAGRGLKQIVAVSRTDPVFPKITPEDIAAIINRFGSGAQQQQEEEREQERNQEDQQQDQDEQVGGTDSVTEPEPRKEQEAAETELPRAEAEQEMKKEAESTGN